MTTTQQTKTGCGSGLWILLGLLAALPSVEGQSPASDSLPPALQEQQAASLTEVPSGGAIPKIGQEPSLLQWGPVSLRPHLFYKLLYSDGVQSAPGVRSKSSIQTIAPGLLLGLGNHWTLDYTPTLTYYSTQSLRDSLDHSVVLVGAGAYGDGTWGFLQSYANTDTPQEETGGQTSQDSFETELSATHRFSDELSLELSLNQSLQFVEAFADTREWSTMNWLSYQFPFRLSVAVGAGLGYVNLEPGTDEIYEQLQARMSWRATEKVSVVLSGGLDIRQSAWGSADSRVNPILGATVQYQPFENTRLSLSAQRKLTASQFGGRSSENTSLTTTLNQRLLGMLYLSLGGGFSTVKYSNLRTDDIYSFDARLSTSFLKRGSVGVFYQYSDKVSNDVLYSYDSHQFGVEVGYRF